MTQVQEFQDNYKGKWDEYVKQSREGTFFHLTGWKEMIEKTFGLKSIYLMALNGADEIQGLLPLFLMRDILGRKYLVSNPYSTYTGVCAVDAQIKEMLFNKAKEIASYNGVQYLEIRQLGYEAFDLPAKTDFVTMFLTLERDEEIIWKKTINAKARNHIRKALKEGVTVETGTNYLDAFYEVLSINIRDLGSPNYPKLFLKNILEHFSGSSNILVAKYNGKVIGGMLYICYKNMIFNPWAASLRKYNGLSPNDLLYWEAIKFACNKGYEYFDFGRSTVNSGTFEFKKKMGGKPVQLYYQYFLNRMRSIPRVSAHDNKYQMVIDVWKKLPVTVAKVIGPKLIRYLPEL